VYARGKSAIQQCAHLENYLGFPGGLSPERFLALGQAHAEEEGATVREDMVVSVERTDDETEGFRVETQDGETTRCRYVLAASAYDGDYLDGLEAALDTADEDEFLETAGGRTSIAGLYAAGWLVDETVHQAVVNAGVGARAAIALIRDEMSARYWPAVGERYVDWMVEDGRYDGEDWEHHVDDWFEREMCPPPEGTPDAVVEQACADLKAEFRGRQIDPDEQARRDDRGQWLLLDQLDDAVIRDYYEQSVDDSVKGVAEAPDSS
jgi:hypothetical protein